MKNESILTAATTKRAQLLKWLLPVTIVLASVCVHVYLSRLGPTYATPLMLLDRVFDIGVVLILSMGFVGVGRIILYAAKYPFHNFIGDTVLAWGLGAGVISHALLLLGVLQLLFLPVVWLVLGSIVLLTAREWRAVGRDLGAAIRSRKRFRGFENVLLFVTVLLVVPIFLSALTPPIEGDALSYQLAAPAQFLAQNAIVPVYENTGANYPLGASLLFVFGLALASPIAAQLVHFMFGIALMGGVYSFTAENFSRPVGLLAAAILWSSPVMGLEASAPLVDLGWVFYEFTAVWLFWRWHRTRSNFLLVLAGLCSGFAISSKYLAFVGWGTLALFVMLDAFKSSGYNLASTIKAVIGFNGAVLGGAVPWLAKNVLFLGNPVYPFFLGTIGLDGQLHKPGGAAGGLGEWVGAGMGSDWKALLSFPVNVYLHWERFDSVKNRGGPSLFFWFLPLYLFVKKQPLIHFLLLLVVVRFAVWWNLTQFVRYGLILFPLVSMICAYIVYELTSQVVGRWTRPMLRVAVGLFLVIGLVLQWGFFFTLRDGASQFLLGLESQTTYLERNLHDALVVRFMNETLPGDANLFALGDTRVFYLERHVIGDVSHANWAEMATLGKTVEGIRERFRILGVTHVWVSQDEIVYAKNFWNIETPAENKTVSFDDFRARYLRQIYQDDRGHTVYQLSPLVPK